MGLGGKHLFGSIGEQRVTFVEKKIEAPRKDFLKKMASAAMSRSIAKLQQIEKQKDNFIHY